MIKKTETVSKREKYYEGVGRRKSAVARVRLFLGGEGKFAVNEKEPKNYFKVLRYEKAALAPLKFLKGEKITIRAKVRGGGPMAQSEAVRLGLARALIGFNPSLRPELKVSGYLSRDAREVERKKYGLKKARRAPQWQKR